MSQRLGEIARQTVVITDAGAYRTEGVEVDIADQVRASIAGTRLYTSPPLFEGTPAEATIEVTKESTLEAARRVGPEAATLVFASARNPGGGFLGGAQAQEESVARSSGLYRCLLKVPEFYEFHREERDLRYSDRVIYSPGVPVFRNDKGRLLEEPYTTSFLTAAAPNLGAILDNQLPYARDVPAVLARRARHVLAVAAANRHRRLVLGAWGCGVFRNDPETVAGAFAEALAAMPCFEQVVFAVWQGRPLDVYAAFQRRFVR
ncbi:TIGR02452 family protein [Hamadaea tsunoensis]|uniref:TIGR02452 family protein n=1 Tax=Hamadaea tsunoensis TaxID=53368 RepID=UPI0003FB140E|nr:TIGR02452 family protein [Hamadaea tsunoensis]